MKKNILILALCLCGTLAFAQDSAIVFHPKRALVLQGTSNFRDLGGYPAANGKMVKWNKIYRSADISELSESDLGIMKNNKIATICDLRGPQELQTKPDKYPTDTRYVNLPAGSENVSNTNYGKINRDSMMLGFYSRTDHLKAKYQPLFDELLAVKNDNSLLFHCTAGKDRTGVGAAIILSALGVDKKYIVADYAATNTFWDNKKMIEMLIKSGMPETNVKAMMAANPMYINTFFETIDKKYHSMEQFLTNELELNETKIKQLRELYLVDKI